VRYGMPGRSLWAVVPRGRMARPCAISHVGAELRHRAWTSRRRIGPVLRLELIAAYIPFASGSLAAFPGMPGKADDARHAYPAAV
jgi:hypothetical protein